MRIEIAKWSEFQHFKNRDPIWIKLYRDLRNKREWRRLGGDEAKCLVDLWMLASEQPERGVIDLPAEDLAWELRCDVKQASTWLQVLATAGFINVISRRRQDDIPRALAREETEAEKETEASANADEGEPSFGDVMAVVRNELHLGKSDDECRRSGSILKRDFLGKVPTADIIDACRGARKLIDAGLVDGAKPRETVGLRFLRRWKYDSEFLWDAALRYERHQPTNAKKRGRTSPFKLSVDVEERAS